MTCEKVKIATTETRKKIFLRMLNLVHYRSMTASIWSQLVQVEETGGKRKPKKILGQRGEIRHDDL